MYNYFKICTVIFNYITASLCNHSTIHRYIQHLNYLQLYSSIQPYLQLYTIIQKYKTIYTFNHIYSYINCSSIHTQLYTLIQLNIYLL